MDMTSLDIAAGTTGEQASRWEAFSLLAWSLLEHGEDPFSLVLQLARVGDAYLDAVAGD